MPFLNREIADALCTVITLGFAVQKNTDGDPLVFEYEGDAGVEDHALIRDAFGNLGVTIFVRASAPQNAMPYILGHNLSQNSLDTFIAGLTRWSDDIRNMFIAANDPGQTAGGPPRGAYIGVQFFTDEAGNILIGKIDGFDSDPRIYGPSALSLHPPLFREITGREEQEIAIAYYNARKSTNDAALAVSKGLRQAIGGNDDKDYIKGRIFGSSHGMIRAMVNNVTPPPNRQSVFAEIALGRGTTKVSSCIPCALFMQSFGYPASSIHLGRGDNWRIPDNPSGEILTNWGNAIAGWYASGLGVFNPAVELEGNNITLDNAAAMIIASHRDVDDSMSEIPNLFLEALTFEGSFIDRIKRTLFP